MKTHSFIHSNTLESMIVYHNPRCRKSREALDYLANKGIAHQIIHYMETPLTEEELSNTLKKLNMEANELLRKNEGDFKKHFKGKSLSEKEWIQAMIDYPKLMQRPIVIHKDKAVVGRPKENIEQLFLP